MTKPLREGVDSQVQIWQVSVRLVTGINRQSIYPFTGVPLAFSSFLFLSFFLIFFFSVLLIFKLFIYFFSFFLSFFFLSFLLFYFLLSPPVFFSFFTLCLSSSTFYHLSMRVLVMSIESNFVFEFIAWVMVIMLVHSICRKWIHVRAWLDKGPETGGFSHVLGVVGIISIFMY